MRGFSEVIGIAVVIVAIYLVLNAIVVAEGDDGDTGLIRKSCRRGGRRYSAQHGEPAGR